jgi:hypothetical protein
MIRKSSLNLTLVILMEWWVCPSYMAARRTGEDYIDMVSP